MAVKERAHNRIPLSRKIPINQIYVDPSIQIDPHFLKLQSLLWDGKIPAALTRIPIGILNTGFFERSVDGKCLHVTDVNRDYVSTLAQMIRSGHRPVLDLYWSAHAPGGGGYVCPDDEVTLAAYLSVGIDRPPCRVLKPRPEPSQDAAIWVQQRGKYLAYAKGVPSNKSNFPSFVGDSGVSIAELIQILLNYCERARESIRKFHCAGDNEVHYHEMLHSIVRRHEATLDSSRRLIELGRIEHAAALVRLGYEAFLNFYIDWLSPHFFGPRMQLASIMAAKSKTNIAPDEFAVLSNFPNLLSKVSEKARLSPLGEIYHNLTYPSLSSVVHQSYGYLEYESKSFEIDSNKDIETEVKHLKQWLDIITASILSCIQADIGTPAGDED